MRVNNPVTNTEYDFDGNRSLYSTTDLAGRITHANPYFIEVSGYTEAELIGAPHNLVRHPDMPPAAFADLWQTIKTGSPWSALVKNRRKNGDYYWVQATVTPIVESGETTGYLSVRTKPTRQQIDAAERLYKAEREKPGTLALRQGRVVRPGLPGRIREAARLSVRQRIALFQSFLLGASGFACWAAWQSGAASGGHAAAAMGLAAASIIVGALFWYYLSVKVIGPIASAADCVRSMAGGDLTVSIEEGRTDELGQLLRAVRQLQSNLRCIVGDIRENFMKIQGATNELVTGNNDLAGRTDSQAAALEETAASMEELASTVKKNAESTVYARDTANAAMVTAQKGGEIMKQVVATMSDISDSSEKIANIVDIINSIASQTNLLALNAAVEAARAGEAGRGFAVVATEVRGLAQRSAEASKEIKQLIDSSVQKVDAGARLSRDAGSVVEQIIGSVNEVSTIIAEISSASAEQSTGIDQVSDAVTQMDEVTQRNASLVDVAARATNDLGDQGGKLMRALAVFKVGGSRSGSSVAASVSTDVAVASSDRAAKPVAKARRVSGTARPAMNGYSSSSRPTSAPLATAVGQDWQEF